MGELRSPPTDTLCLSATVLDGVLRVLLVDEVVVHVKEELELLGILLRGASGDPLPRMHAFSSAPRVMLSAVNNCCDGGSGFG